MESTEIATISSRGQVVIPQGVRNSLNIKAGTKFFVLGEGDTIIFKRLEIPATAEIKALLAKSRAVARKSGIKPSEVEKVIKKVRSKE
jgi:AbrB family looped-hinge helix DNA binding protein